MRIVLLAMVGCRGEVEDPARRESDTGTDDTATTTETGTGTGDTGTTSTGEARVQTILALQGVAADGAPEYTQQCLVCHPRPGDEPGPYPPLEDVIPSRSDIQLIRTILDGTVGQEMVSYADYFTNQQIRDLVAYLRATF